MSKPELSCLRNSVMTQNQLVDKLTSHISLYHSHSSPSNSNPKPNPTRSSILKWFSSLTPHQRQAHLTALDSKFVQTLLQMLATLRTRGHGFFIVLPDLLSGDLPSICFKRSHGLLSRVSESNELERTIFESTRLFSSREGEAIGECSSSVKNLDTLTVSGEFVENFDRFVEAMDGVSNGAFLRGEESELGSDWVELEWLKDKGYYSIESFVANRLEVALRLAWLNCNSGKKRGVKLKEKVSAAGMAVNVFWRKKGCVDWWENLDASTRRKVFTAILGKAAKSLCSEIMKATSNASEDELWLFNIGVERPLRCNYTVNKRETKPTLAADAEFGSNIVPASLSGKPASLSNFSNSLFVLQDIVTMTLCQDSEYDKGKIFFSSLSSICTVSDFILRKVRGFLMVISLDCTKLELIAEDNVKSSPVKSKGKVGACNHKKKGRTRNTKKLNPVSGECVTVDSRDKSPKDLDCALSHKEKSELVESKKSPDVPQRKVIDSEASLLKEPAKAVGVGKAATRKTRREKGKNRMNGFKNPVEMTNCKRPVVEASSSSIVSQDDATNSCPVSAHLTFQNISGENSAENNILASNSVPSASFNGPIEEDQTPQSIQENRGPECCHFNESVRDNNTMEAINCKADVNVIPSSVHALDTNVSGNENSSFDESVHISEIDVKLASPKKGVRVFDIKEKHVLLQKQESRHVSDTATLRSLDGLPYEWPFVASTYFPPVNPHLLPATDRLHLDAGRNWHHHFRQSFVPAIHQRNIEGGCNPVLSRRVPMSLDWPPMVRGTCGLAPSLTCSNYDSGFISRWHCTFPQGFSINGTTTDDERKHSGDYNDPPDLISKHELSDDWDSHWISEDEVDVHAVSGIDYNEYFGGGVMYWNPSDHPAGGFSRPPSLSSDDSSWAWREADMNRAVDDMVAFSSPYSTNGLTSPTASFCSPFDKLGPAHQALGFVLTGNDVPGKVLHSPSAVTDSSVEEDASRSLTELTGDVEGNTGDSLPYHILPPIVIPNMTRDRSRSEFKSSHDVKSPCVPLKRREQSRMKRPPSPVVRCVTRAPRPPPPPPSPVSESRKHRGFPTVRSGSSSPRHWGVRGLFHDGASLEEACLYRDGAEVVWPSWRNTSFSGHSMIQPLPAALLQDRLLAMSHLARDQEHPDVALPMQPTELQSCPTRKASLSLMHTLLHDEIDSFCKQVASQNLSRKPYITWAVKRVTRSLQVLWPRSRTNIFGSNATGLALPTSDVDLVVCLPPVRNLEPIKEAGILEGRNGIKETCLQHAARYLANQDWVKNDSLKTVENTAIPIIMLVVEVPCDLIASSTSNVQSPKEEPSLMSAEQVSKVHLDGVVIEEPVLPKCSQMNYDTSKDSISVRIDISFKSPSHTGLQTTELVKELTEQFTAAMPLALVLKQFLADRSLDQSYSGGLSSYCLSLLITRFLQHEHHLGRPINQNFGSLLMDFLYFFGYVFDPRQMRISVRGSGIYIKRERGCSIDPIHIDDPLFPTNNVGRNCFRIHQCIKAFSEAYTILESELTSLSDDGDTCTKPSCRLLPKIIPSIDLS